MADFNRDMYERDYVEVEMRYVSQYGEESTIMKKLPIDYLGLSELEIINEVYKSFLHGCGFYIHPDDEIEIKRYK